MWWYAYWYLVRGRKAWNVAWIDPALLESARARLETIGPLDGFEPIDGVKPLHLEEILDGAQFGIELPSASGANGRHVWSQ